MKEKKGLLRTSEIPVIEKKSAHAASLVGKHRDILDASKGQDPTAVVKQWTHFAAFEEIFLDRVEEQYH